MSVRDIYHIVRTSVRVSLHDVYTLMLRSFTHRPEKACVQMLRIVMLDTLWQVVSLTCLHVYGNKCSPFSLVLENSLLPGEQQ